MSDREEFEKALRLYTSQHITGSTGLICKIASHFYDLRQPEIDALTESLSEAVDVGCRLTSERDALKADVEQFKSGNKIIGSILHRNTAAMQAAWIEWKHGGGAEEAMQWIENTLDGPDLIPDEDEPNGKDAQAYFDAAMKEKK